MFYTKNSFYLFLPIFIHSSYFHKIYIPKYPSIPHFSKMSFFSFNLISFNYLLSLYFLSFLLLSILYSIYILTYDLFRSMYLNSLPKRTLCLFLMWFHYNVFKKYGLQNFSFWIC